MGRDYCCYLRDGVLYKISDVKIIAGLDLSEELQYPNPPINYTNLKNQIIDLFKNHLCSLEHRGQALNCFSKTGYEGDLCVIETNMSGEDNFYHVYFITTFTEEFKIAFLTITLIERATGVYLPCC